MLRPYVRKSCIICRNLLIPKNPNVKKLNVIRCGACTKPFHLKCCDPSWLINDVTVCCCAIVIRRHSIAQSQPSVYQNDYTCAEINRRSDRRESVSTPPTPSNTRKRFASPPSPTTAHRRKVPCIEPSVYQQQPVDSIDSLRAGASALADSCSYTADSIADDEFVCFHASDPSSPSACFVSDIAMQQAIVDMEVENSNLANAPAWFMGFMNIYRRDIKMLSDRLEAVVQSHSSQLKQHETELVSLRSEISSLRDEQRSSDNGELVITGIPSDVALTDSVIVEKVLETIKLPHLHQHLIDTRPWLPASSSSTASTAERPANSNTNSNPNGNNTNVNTRGFVCKFVSESVRDAICAHSNQLGATDSNQLFGSSAKFRIFLRPLWPKPLFDLWRKSCEKATILNYMRPYVQRRQVYLRASRNSVPLKINNEADLATLVPLTPPPPPARG